MKSKRIIGLAMVLSLGPGLSPVLGQGTEMRQMKEQVQTQEQVFGWQLMSEKERLEHRQQMQQMNTEEEREAFRRKHHEKMQERARQKGVTLPEEPGMQGKGMGPGGGGMGPGGGMGGGKR